MMAEYIEREALICNIKNEIEQQRKMGNVFATTAFAHIKGVVDKFPSADVVEVRHAHWIEDDREATCSGCKSRTFNWAAWSFDYCPFCGSKMGGKGEGE